MRLCVLIKYLITLTMYFNTFQKFIADLGGQSYPAPAGTAVGTRVRTTKIKESASFFYSRVISGS